MSYSIDLSKHLDLPKNDQSSQEPSTLRFEENIIRREKNRKIIKKHQTERMRAELPKYDLTDIRFYKLPFYDALMLKLKQDKYTSTEAYLQQLMELNDQVVQEAIRGQMEKPSLKQCKDELKTLSDALIAAEDANRNGDIKLQTEIILKLAIDFAFNYTNWFWLAEDLICQAINHSKGNQKLEAICRFSYAKMLIEKVRDFDNAQEQLNVVRTLSIGQIWTTKNYFPQDNNCDNTLYMNANYLLHLCLMRQAKIFSKMKPQEALDLAKLARKRASEACHYDGETMSLFLKGQIELDLGLTKEAISSFRKAYYIQAKLKSEKGLCEALVELSKAYLLHGDTRTALQNLMNLKAKAEEHGLMFYLAQAYRYLGEYYLNSGEPRRATPLLLDALKMFHETEHDSESAQVRNLGALSSGLELMPAYISLLQRTDKRHPQWYENLMTLVRWKDSREPFWKEVATIPAMESLRISLTREISDTLNLDEYHEMSNMYGQKKFSSLDNLVARVGLKVVDGKEQNEERTLDNEEVIGVEELSKK